jgi:hypothetical protein
MTLTKLMKGLAPVGLLAALPSTAFAAANLQSDDFVGISFWLISMALMASTVFFPMGNTKRRWKVENIISGIGPRDLYCCCSLLLHA